MSRVFRKALTCRSSDLTVAPVSDGTAIRLIERLYLLVSDLLWLHQRLHRRHATAHLALTRTLAVVAIDPVVQLRLQLVNGSVDLAPERYLVELLQDRFVELLTDAIGLRVTYLGLGVLNVVDGQI